MSRPVRGIRLRRRFYRTFLGQPKSWRPHFTFPNHRFIQYLEEEEEELSTTRYTNTS